MGRVRLAVVWCGLFFGLASGAAAQPLLFEPAPNSDAPAVAALTIDQERELTAWIAAMEKWQRYDAKWHNRPVHNEWGGIAERRPRPQPPDWLEAHCAAARAARVLDLQEWMETACRVLADPRTPMKAVPTPAQAARLQAEAPAKHTSFLTRMHIDGLWSTASTHGRIYGLVGSHFSLVDVGRLQIFGPPGVILLSVPDGAGGRRVSLGYTWGVSVRLTDARLFGQKDMTLFLNVSKVWVNGGGSAGANARGFDAIGFSLAPRKKK
jgi:hypothetical protein